VITGEAADLPKQGYELIVKLAAEQVEGSLVDGAVLGAVSADDDEHVL
jgi:hypothetical protein